MPRVHVFSYMSDYFTRCGRHSLRCSPMIFCLLIFVPVLNFLLLGVGWPLKWIENCQSDANLLPKLDNKEIGSSIQGTPFAHSITHPKESQLLYCKLLCGQAYMARRWCLNEGPVRMWGQSTAMWMNLKADSLSKDLQNDCSPRQHFGRSLQQSHGLISWIIGIIRWLMSTAFSY